MGGGGVFVRRTSSSYVVRRGDRFFSGTCFKTGFAGMRNEYSVFVEASKRKFILAAVEDMKRRTANAAKGLKNFDLTHKITRRKEAEVKLKSLKKFIPDLDVPAVTQQYLALITSLGNSPEHSSIISKLQFAIRTGGYENIIPVFQLALSSIG